MRLHDCLLCWLLTIATYGKPQDTDLGPAANTGSQYTHRLWVEISSDEDTPSKEVFDEYNFRGIAFDDNALNKNKPDENMLEGNAFGQTAFKEDTTDRITSGKDIVEIDTTISTTSDDSEYQQECTVYAPKISVVSWVPEEQIVYTTEIMVGIVTTLVFLCNYTIVAKRTQTEFHWDAAPVGMYPPLLTTNDRGNALAIVAFTDAATTSIVELVYPNSHIAFDTRFSWNGTIRNYDYSGHAMYLTATPQPSTTSLRSYIPLPRDYYSEPTATRDYASVTSWPGSQPLWVPLDSQLPVDFFNHFLSILFQQEYPSGISECQETAILDRSPSTFYVPRYAFDHKSMSIDLDAPGMGNDSSARRWRNSTGSGVLCADSMEQFAGLCEMPKIRNECVNTITIWDDTTDTHYSFPNSADDRSGRFPVSTTGFETAYDLTDTVAPFLYATKDWELDAKGGIITPAVPPASREIRILDASEAAAIWRFFKDHTSVGSWSMPQRTQPPTKSAQGLMPIKSEALSQYFKEPVLYSEQPVATILSAGTMGVIPTSSITIKANELAAVGSAFVRIFFQSTPSNRAFPGASILIASSREIKSITPAVISISTPITAKEEAVNAAANMLPESTATTSRELLYVQVSVIIDGVPTTLAGYILPVTSTVMAGQEITVDGHATDVAVPDLLPMYLPTTTNGVPTSTLGYIVSGRYTATVGHTIIVNDRPIVLSIPDAVFTQLPTSINNMSTMTLAYVISGSSIASIGQRVILNGTPTILAPPHRIPTYIATMTNGVEESRLAYIITGELIATIGQTVTVEGSVTVLAEPTSQPRVVEGAAHRNSEVLLSAILIGVSVFLVACL